MSLKRVGDRLLRNITNIVQRIAVKIFLVNNPDVFVAENDGKRIYLEIMRRVERSRIEAGSMVGALASSSLGEVGTDFFFVFCFFFEFHEQNVDTHTHTHYTMLFGVADILAVYSGIKFRFPFSIFSLSSCLFSCF